MLKWKGLLAEIDAGMRRRALSMMLLVCISMVVTQTSYIVVGDAHLIFGLVPVVVTSLLFGTQAGTGMGTVMGLFVMLHARYAPNDVYERYFQSPVTSVFLFALIGFFMGVLYSLVDRYRGEKSWRRHTSVMLSCLLGSLLFTCVFQGASYLINSYLAIPVPSRTITQLLGPFSFFTQFLADFAMMTICSIGIEKLNEQRLSKTSVATIKELFSRWLIISIVIGYIGIISISYALVSSSCKENAEKTLQSQIEYINSELANRDKLLGSVARHVRISNASLKLINSSTISTLSSSMGLENHCIVALADNGAIVASNMEDTVGKGFLQVVGSGFTYGFDESLFEEKTSSDWYLPDGSICYLRASEMGYVRGSDSGIYQIMAAVRISDVYHIRTITMILLSLGFLLILGLIITQARILIDEYAIKGIKETRETLDRIAQKETDANVDVQGSDDFVELSKSINDALDSVAKT